jgi:hypothetical protein
MVSRFLVSMDVAGMSDTTVPWPTNMKEVSCGLFLSNCS